MNDYTLDLLETKIKRIKELEEENKRLTKNQRYYKNGVFSLENDKDTMSDMIDDYKSRIDKAIDYINKFETIRAYFEYTDEDGYDEYDYDDTFRTELLKILKGEENE